MGTGLESVAAVKVLEMLLARRPRITKIAISFVEDIKNKVLAQLLLNYSAGSIDDCNAALPLSLQAVVLQEGGTTNADNIPSDPSAFTKEESTRLKIAASNGHLEAVQKIIEKLRANSDPESYTSAASMALELAARFGHLAIVQFLLHNGASPHGSGQSGIYPLHTACGKGIPNATNTTAIVRTLLDSGADPEMRDKQGLSAFDIAAEKQSAECMKLLTAKAADLQSTLQPALSVKSPVWYAIEKGQDETAISLFSNCSINYLEQLSWQNVFCLVPAVKRATSRVLDILLDMGLDADARLQDRSFLIHHASKDGGTLATLQTLLSRGVDTAVKDQNGLTPVHHIASGTGPNREEKMRSLIGSGAIINNTTPSGQTALLLAVLSGALTLLPMLLVDGGLDTNHKDESGRTALMDCVGIKSPDVLEMGSMLLEAG